VDTKKEHIDFQGASLLLGVSALLGLNQVCIKFVNVGMGPIFQAGLRSVCALLVVWLFATIMGRRLGFRDGSVYAGIVSGFLFAFEFMLLFQALDYISVSRASVLFYTMPFWLTLAAHFLIPTERLTALKLLGLLLALGGVSITLGDNPNEGSDNGRSLLGDVFCLIAACGWAGIAILIRTTKLQRASPEMQLIYQLAVSAPILLLVAALSGDIFREPDALVWAVFTFQVVVVVSAGFLTWFWVLSIYPVAKMAVFSFLAPIFGVFFGWLILDERITASVIISLLLISAGIAMVNWPSSKLQTTSI